MKRFELFKMAIYVANFAISKDKYESEKFVESLSYKDAHEIKNKLNIGELNFDNIIMNYFLFRNLELNKKDYCLSKMLYEDIEAPIKNKDFYFKALFNEIFYVIDIKDDNIQKLLHDYNKKLHNSFLINMNKFKYFNCLDIAESGHLLYLTNNDEVTKDDGLYNMLCELLFELLKNFLFFNFNVLPKICCMRFLAKELTDIIHSKSYKNLIDFFEKPYVLSTLDISPINDKLFL